MEKVNHEDCIQMERERIASVVNDDVKWKEFIEELQKEGSLTSMGLRQALAKEAVKRASLKYTRSESSRAELSEAAQEEINEKEVTTEEDESSSKNENELLQSSLRKLFDSAETNVPGLSSLASLMSKSSSSSLRPEEKRQRRASIGRRLWRPQVRSSSSSINLAGIEQTPTKGDILTQTIESALDMGSLEFSDY
eukprot:CAMPEP_0195301298 /NCGR_PEP_ID=MMETSP0707-20130614/29057_1 /TAXON_ID=33640 /ORGANISM="Asterionellopsis glacialis, Strain CCMP134" /LENGTH=194 /DNA_ID=CAMNT_0040364201 /DNA_START=159 /DNA_END=743 /DNA_ORIENTATION=-